MRWCERVICKNTNLVHPTWLAHTLFEIFVCSLSIRQVLDFAIIHNHFGSFSVQWPMFKILEHYRWSWGGVRDPCHMHKYKSCASSLARSHPPWDFCVQCKYIQSAFLICRHFLSIFSSFSLQGMIILWNYLMPIRSCHMYMHIACAFDLVL
jgi:hypothetical protein